MSVALIGLAFLLGIKHSYDADHLVAVSSVLARVRSFALALAVGASWAVGHMLTAAIVTTLLFIFKDSLLTVVLPHFEKIVGVLLIVLGAWSFKGFVFHQHVHVHQEREHAHLALANEGAVPHLHRYMFGVGIIHGLASNDELLALFTVTLGVASLGGVLLGVGVFSIGVVVGMLAFCAAFSIPVLRMRSEMAGKLLAFATGFVSISYGISLLI